MNEAYIREMLECLRKRLEKDIPSISRARILPIVDMLCDNDIQQRGGEQMLSMEMETMMKHIFDCVLNAKSEYDADLGEPANQSLPQTGFYE